VHCRTSVDAEDRRGRRRVQPWPEHQAGLEQGQIAEAAADVAQERTQQAGQQRRSHQRLIFAQRVRQPDRPAAGIVGR
jgi:hypothetical protein